MKVKSGQRWFSVANPERWVKVDRVSKNAVFYHSATGGGKEISCTHQEFVQKFNLISATVKVNFTH